MNTITIPKAKIQSKINGNEKIREFKMKADILDELVELIEDKYLGSLMRFTEKEKNISLKKAKPLLH